MQNNIEIRNQYIGKIQKQITKLKRSINLLNNLNNLITNQSGGSNAQRIAATYAILDARQQRNFNFNYNTNPNDINTRLNILIIFLEKQITKLLDQKIIRMNEITQLRSELNRLQTNNNRLQTNNNELQTDNNRLQNNNNELQSLNRRLQDVNVRLNDTNVRLNDTNVRLNDTNVTLNNELTTFANKLEELKNIHPPLINTNIKKFNEIVNETINKLKFIYTPINNLKEITNTKIKNKFNAIFRTGIRINIINAIEYFLNDLKVTRFDGLEPNEIINGYHHKYNQESNQMFNNIDDFIERQNNEYNRQINLPEYKPIFESIYEFIKYYYQAEDFIRIQKLAKELASQDDDEIDIYNFNQYFGINDDDITE